jgi:hypothetical protein
VHKFKERLNPGFIEWKDQLTEYAWVATATTIRTPRFGKTPVPILKQAKNEYAKLQ